MCGFEHNYDKKDIKKKVVDDTEKKWTPITSYITKVKKGLIFHYHNRIKIRTYIVNSIKKHYLIYKCPWCELEFEQYVGITDTKFLREEDIEIEEW